MAFGTVLITLVFVVVLVTKHLVGSLELHRSTNQLLKTTTSMTLKAKNSCDVFNSTKTKPTTEPNLIPCSS